MSSKKEEALASLDAYGVLCLQDQNLIELVGAADSSNHDLAAGNNIACSQLFCGANQVCEIDGSCVLVNYTCPVNNGCTDILC